MKGFDFKSLRLLRVTVALTAGIGLATLFDPARLTADPEGTIANPPSVVKGKPSGIGVGDFAPDFQLESVEVSGDFKRWLGDKAPKTFEDKVMLSDFAGKAPIVLVFGSFT